MANLLFAQPATVAYAVLAARRVYGQSWPSTLWKVGSVHVINLVSGSLLVLGWTGLVIALY